MRAKRGICFALFLPVFLAACLFGRPFESGAAAAGAGRQMGMEVSYGFGDTAKSDRYLRVTVVLDNPGESAVEGSVEILTTQSSKEVYQYVYPVTVAAGAGEKKELYIPLGLDADQMFVTFTDAGGGELARKRLKLNISRDLTESFVGILSDDPGALSYLDDAGIYYGSIRTRAVMLDASTAPQSSLGYDQLDLVVVSDFDLGSLSESQFAALAGWEEDGGVLLFGGGARYRENMGPFAQELLKPPFQEAQMTVVDLSAEKTQDQTVEARLTIPCVDLNLKNGGSLLQGESFPLLSYVNRGKGRIVTAAFSLRDIAGFCRETPSFVEKFYTMVLGEERISRLSQEDFFGFSGQYFDLQGLINTGNAGRLPNVFLYTVVIIIYLLLIGPVIYLMLRKRGIHRYYMAGVTACALVFTGVIYIMGIKTRFRAPFFTYATILDTSRGEAREETYINVRSPYNNPYSVKLRPEYQVRPVTKGYYYDVTTTPRFTGTEDYKTSLQFLADRTEIRIRDTVAFTPKLFTLRRQAKQEGDQGLEGQVKLFDGRVSGSLVNRSDKRLENAVLLFYGKAVLLGDLEPGEEIRLEEREALNYPLNYSYALAQLATGGDRYSQVDIDDEGYLRYQERSRLLNFYLNSRGTGYASEARVVAFTPEKNQKVFLLDEEPVTEGLTMLTQEVELTREEDGLVYRSALEQKPAVISGNYNSDTNSIYTGEPVEPAIIEYSLGNDLKIERVNFETLSEPFVGNPQYPYLTPFTGAVYFYNYNTGRHEPVELKESFTAAELAPYLSPSNTLTVKYVSEESGDFGRESHLPMLYVIGREK